jgi:hypothetical protein
MTPRTGPGLGNVLYTGPFHDAFRAAVRERGLTLDRLRWHLAQRGVAVARSTLSDWQLGHRRPGRGSLPAVSDLEDLLGLPQRSLVRLLDAPGAGPGGVDERAGAFEELLDSVPGAREYALEVLSAQEKVTLDPWRRRSLVWARTLVRAARDDVDRCVLQYSGDPGCAIDAVRLCGLENCRLGTLRRHPAGVLVAELLFDTVLRAGQTWVFEHQVRDGTAGPSTGYARGFREPAALYVLEVRFPAGHRPTDCHSFGRAGPYERPYRIADLAPTIYNAVHLSGSGTPGGVLGLGWRWPACGPA